MATYSFKSVGKTQEQIQLEQLNASEIPFGIKTPLRPGTKDALFEMNYKLEDQFADNLRNLLLTNWGERVGLYNFGANLRPLVAEIVSQDEFDTAAIDRIRQAVSTWMPFIDLEDFSSNISRTKSTGITIVEIQVTYSIPALQTGKKSLKISLYAI